MSISASIRAVFLAAGLTSGLVVNQAAAENLASQVMPTARSEIDAKSKLDKLVAANICIAIDASGSIVGEEDALMVEGVKDAIRYITRDNNKKYAVAIVRYGTRASLSPSHIFRTAQGAEQLIQEELRYDPHIPPSRLLGLGIDTDIFEAIERCALVFQFAKEANGLNIYPERNALVIIGDGLYSHGSTRLDPKPLKQRIIELAQEYGVTTYPIPINDLGGGGSVKIDVLTDYFSRYLTTPPGLQYKNIEVYGDFLQNVPPSEVIPAYGFEDVGRATQRAFMSAGL